MCEEFFSGLIHEQILQTHFIKFEGKLCKRYAFFCTGVHEINKIINLNSYLLPKG
jgi:hypothetical protein